MFICNFDIGLSNLTAKQQKNFITVLSILHKHKRFSVFDICTDNLAAMIDALLVGGYIKDVGGSFPWTEFELAPKALEMIKHRLPE